MVEAFYGTWNQVYCTNFDEFMKALGACHSLQEKAKIPVTIVISQDGDKVGVNIKNPHKKYHVFAKLGEEFDETTIDDRVARTTVAMEGDKLVHVQKWDGKEMRIEREIKDGKMVVTLNFEGVTAVRRFEKV